MVEAAVVFPLVILTMFVLIYAMAFFYDQVAASSGTHRATLAAAGDETGTYRVVPRRDHKVTLASGGSWRGSVTGTREVRFAGVQGMAKARTTRMESRSYVLDEKGEIRLWDVLL